MLLMTLMLLWYHCSMVTKLEHSPECVCERCTEKLALIVWTNRLFQSLTVQAVRERVRLLEARPIAPEDLEALATAYQLPQRSLPALTSPVAIPESR